MLVPRPEKCHSWSTTISSLVNTAIISGELCTFIVIGDHFLSMDPSRLFSNSWCKFPFDPALANWVRHVLPTAKQARFDNAHKKWLRCGETWFVGVNALPNDTDGAIAGGPPLAGIAVDFLRDQPTITPLEWEAAQVSICYPGYPQPMTDESDAAFRFRRDKNAVHIDGILPEGDKRRRHLREHHRFILGIPLTHYDETTAPLVVWEGSHEIVRETLRRCYADRPAALWGDVDITEVYHDLRNRIFAECDCVAIVVEPGESYLVHRLALHGIAPWQSPAAVDPDGRIICYFRPETASPEEWLEAP